MEHNLEIGSVVSTSELETIQRHRENNQTCYVSEMCEHERLKTAYAELTAERDLWKERAEKAEKELAGQAVFLAVHGQGEIKFDLAKPAEPKPWSDYGV